MAQRSTRTVGAASADSGSSLGTACRPGVAARLSVLRALEDGHVARGGQDVDPPAAVGVVGGPREGDRLAPVLRLGPDVVVVVAGGQDDADPAGLAAADHQ